MLIFIAILTSNFLLAQQNSLEIKGTQNNLYLEHTITPQEGFYSIGRMYNVNAKELAAFNHLKFETSLNIGNVLKIPLNKTNFTQTGVKAKTQANVPVYHTIESGETLYRLGVNYNRVPLASLKKWNHLQSNDVSVGSPMIVGFLKVDKAGSSLANVAAKPASSVPVVAQKNQKPAENKTEEIAAAIPQIAAADPQIAKSSSATPDQPAPNNKTANNVNIKSVASGFSGGYFKNLYSRQTANKSLIDKNGEAGVFKSTSGWQDGKYYCFYNSASAGTVLKITNNATGKSVYAKVLDAIPDIKQNEGLTVILSNAAADELGAGENNFSCVVSFGK
jgi:LysM repeat protein